MKHLPILWSWLFKGLCLTGLLWQLVTIIDLYFKFKVSTATHVSTLDLIEPLATTLCVRLDDVLDIKRLNADLKTNYTKKNKSLSLRNLFDYTPSKDIVDELFYKTKNSSKFKHTKDPKEVLHVTKFLHRQNVCYKIVLKNDEALEYREISVSTMHQFFMKTFTFNRSIENATQLRIMVGPLNALPYKALISAPQEIRHLFVINGSAYADVNRYWINHMTIEKIELPSPYESHCFPYKRLGLHDQHKCIEECVSSQVLSKFGKVSILSPVTEKLAAKNEQIFSISELMKDDKNKNFWKIQKNCQSIRCKRHDCHDNEVVTFSVAHAFTKSSSNEVENKLYPERQLHLRHRIVPQLSFKIVSKPTLSFVEFAVYILSTFSTWTGLSIVACNPVNVSVLSEHLMISRKTRDTEKSKRRRTQRLVGQFRALSLKSMKN